MINNNREEKGNWLQRLITKYIILNPPKFDSKSDYESINNFKNKLIFIEKEKNKNSADNYIPCLFFRNRSSSNYLIYFHGNSEHIFQIEHYGLDFRSYLDMNVIMVEYPGYSIYPYQDPDSNVFFDNTTIIYDWIKDKFKADDDQIFVCGRSLGTGSAIYLSSKRKPKALFLISAFTSLKNIGKDFWVSYFVEEIFNSYRYITNIKCPILFIHGEKDSLINYKHSQLLSEEMRRTNNYVDLVLHPNMTHNDFDLKDDIIIPIQNFIDKYSLRSCQIAIDMTENELKDLYKIPASISKIVESKLFDINNFKFNKIIEKRKAMFSFISLDEEIIFTSGSKILMYNHKNYNLDEEIDVKTNNINEVINSLFQLKNKNIVCGTNKGNIIILEKDAESEEIKEKMPLQLKEEIFKIEKFNPILICILTKDELLFYDELFNEKNPIYTVKLQSVYFDLVQISNAYLALLSHDHLLIVQIKQNELEEIAIHKINLSNYRNNNMIITNKYIIIGGSRYIYYLKYTGNLSTEKMNKLVINQDINYICKVHEECFLASTKEGSIIQININNDIFEIKEQNLISKQIYSLFLKNYKTILLTDDENIQIWNNQYDSSFCSIF